MSRYHLFSLTSRPRLSERLRSWLDEPDVCDDAAAEVALCGADGSDANDATSGTADAPVCAECGSSERVSLYEPLPPDTGDAMYLCADCWNDYYQQCEMDQTYREDSHEVAR